MQNPQPLVPRNPDLESIDARIERAEQRLIAREERLQRIWVATGQRFRSALRPQRLLPPLLGAGVTLGVLVWLLRRPAGVAAAATSRPVAPTHAGEAVAAPWLGVLTFVWPWLPARWRLYVSPATASAVWLLARGPLRQLFSRTLVAPLPGLPCADLQPGSGRWYELARLPAPSGGYRGPVVVECRERPDGSLAVTRHGAVPGGGQPVRHGVLRLVPDVQDALLKISFLPAWLRWWPPGWIGCRLLHFDLEQGTALIGSLDRRLLRLLARRPTLALEQAHALRRIALDCGFAVEQMHWAEVDPAG